MRDDNCRMRNSSGYSTHRSLGKRAIRNPQFAIRNARPGVVLVMTILALVLLVGLIFYVYNVGQQVNSRMTLQHSADSAAISGSTWMARSLNQVAMNNVGQSKMYATVLVLDSLPLATDMSLHEATAWQERLKQQLADGVPNSHGEGRMISAGLEALRSRMEHERDILSAMNDTLSTFPMESITYYAVPGNNNVPPTGQLWKAAQAMDEFSRATVASSGTLAQSNAIRWGKENGTNVQTAFLTPIVPRIPAKRGTFADFMYPIEGVENVYDPSHSPQFTLQDNGGAGGAIPDMAYPYRLGPWARLHRWRFPIPASSENSGTPGDGTPPITQVSGGDNIQIGPSIPPYSGGGGGSIGGGTVTQIGYTTYGPYKWELESVKGWASNDDGLPDTEFGKHMDDISHIKLHYMFPKGSGSRKIVKRIHNPEWHTDYNECLGLRADPKTHVTELVVFKIEIASSVPRGDARWLTPGTYRANVPRNPPQADDSTHLPYFVRYYGRMALAKWGQLESLPKISNHVWWHQYTYQTTNDPEIGITIHSMDHNGQPDWQTVYVASYYIWGGIDVGGDVDVRNPCNWPDGTELPAPTLLDTTSGDYDAVSLDPDAGFRREYFAYLGTAQAGQPQLQWGSRFGTGSPSGLVVATAQAKVFNRSSFDLWTQDWETDLMPVTNLDAWMSKMASGADQAIVTNGLLTPTQVTTVHDYLNKLDPEMVKQQTKH